MNTKQDKEPKQFSNVEMKYLHHVHMNGQNRSSINLRLFEANLRNSVRNKSENVSEDELS